MMDRATLLGTVAALALVVGVACQGGMESLGALWQTPAAILVVGGVVCTAWAASSGQIMRRLGGTLGKAVVASRRDPEELVATVVVLAQTARRDGLLALEKPVELLEDDFLKRAMRMVVDGTDARVIEQVCRTELESTDLRHAIGSGLFDTMGRTAPVFGMMGTLVGLATMLGRMDDPAQIGPGVAVALLATLYGLVVGHVFCLPLSRKLTHRSGEELLYKTMALAGALAIQAGDHPRMVEQRLRAHLPAKKFVPPPVELPAPPVADVGRQGLLRALRPLAVWSWLSRSGRGAKPLKTARGPRARPKSVKTEALASVSPGE